MNYVIREGSIYEIREGPVDHYLVTINKRVKVQDLGQAAAEEYVRKRATPGDRIFMIEPDGYRYSIAARIFNRRR